MSSYEEIRPRELKPALYELDGISREAVEAHYKLYQGYVNKRNEILGALEGVDLSKANQVYSELRALKVDLSFAIGGIKNHELYFEHLGGDGGDPGGAIAGLLERVVGVGKVWEGERHTRLLRVGNWVEGYAPRRSRRVMCRVMWRYGCRVTRRSGPVS